MSEQETSPDIIKEASAMGWVPKEQFRGDPEKWSDAETFVDRGKHFMPILRANNRRLQEEHSRLLQEVTGLKSLLTASSEAIEELKAFHSEDTKAKVAAVKQRVIEQLKTAKTDGDVEAEIRLTDELVDLRAAEKALPVKEEKKPTPSKTEEDAPDPELIEWASVPENAWFGKDRRKTSLAFAIATELREDPRNARLVGKAFYDRVAEEVNSTLGVPSRSEPSDKVEGSRGGRGGPNSSGGKSYTDLPKEAKETCASEARKLVGAGRAFKDMASWQAYYAKIYFSDEE
jgi:hypothetical protein